jgi:hypothetical protein
VGSWTGSGKEGGNGSGRPTRVCWTVSACARRAGPVDDERRRS